MEKLGLQPSLLIAQIVNFSIIIIVLSKLLYKPILKMLEKRKKEIEEGLALTGKMRQEEEKLVEKKEKILETARKEALVVIEEARKQAKDEEKEIVAKAHEEAQEIITKAKAETEHLHQELGKQLRRETVSLAVAMAKRLLSGILTENDQRKLLAKHLEEIENVKLH